MGPTGPSRPAAIPWDPAWISRHLCIDRPVAAAAPAVGSCWVRPQGEALLALGLAERLARAFSTRAAAGTGRADGPSRSLLRLVDPAALG